MNVEMNGKTDYNPKWWDKWLRKNLKKKEKLFPKKVK
jgi:hypothetical protein